MPKPLTKYLVWIDLETSGLDARKDKVLEIACVITDAKFKLVNERALSMPIYYDDKALLALKRTTTRAVQEMHAATGLWDRVQSKQAETLRYAEQRVCEYIERNTSDATALERRIAGNTVSFDLEFLRRHMAKIPMLLDYHPFDVSVIAELARLNGVQSYPKRRSHTALEDIFESLAELRYLDSHIVWD